MPEMLAAGHAVYSELKNLCVWSKNNAGMGTFYRSSTSSCSYGRTAPLPTSIPSSSDNTVGRDPTSGNIRASTASGPAGSTELAMHPTVKPVALVADAIKDCSRRNGLVLDPLREAARC